MCAGGPKIKRRKKENKNGASYRQLATRKLPHEREKERAKGEHEQVDKKHFV